MMGVFLPFAQLRREERKQTTSRGGFLPHPSCEIFCASGCLGRRGGGEVQGVAQDADGEGRGCRLQVNLEASNPGLKNLVAVLGAA